METSRPSFIKMVLPSTMEENKLKLPFTFVRKHRSELGDVAELATPNGSIWEVELIGGKKNIWFSKGWNKFVKDYSVCCGCSLWFSYKGMSKFDVRIYGTSECEIEYPCEVLHGERPNDRKRPPFECKTEIEDDDDYGIKECNPYPSGREASSSKKAKIVRGDKVATGKKGFKRCKVAGGAKRGNDSKQGRSNPDKLFGDGKSRNGNGIPPKRNAGRKIIAPLTISNTLEKKQPATRRAYLAAKDSNPKNPAFIVILSTHYILNVPNAFSKSYISRRSKFIRVQVNADHGVREWRLEISHGARQMAAISTGWIEVVKSNNLERGDVCLFELISSKPLVLQASFFRARSFR